MKTDKNKIILQVEGMTCANCAIGIKKHLENKGLSEVNVNFSTGEASCNYSNEYTEKQVENVILSTPLAPVLAQGAWIKSCFRPETLKNNETHVENMILSTPLAPVLAQWAWLKSCCRPETLRKQ